MLFFVIDHVKYSQANQTITYFNNLYMRESWPSGLWIFLYLLYQSHLIILNLNLLTFL